MDSSRELPANIFDIRGEKSCNWTEEIILSDKNNNDQIKQSSTLSTKLITDAGKSLFEYFKNNKIKLKILEIMSGNCEATKIILESLKDTVESMICTDIVDYPNRIALENINFNKANAVDAVKEYGHETNALLMCSPPPENNYCDLYAIKDYIDQANETKYIMKYIIFIGELGMSDGSNGLDKFMNEEPSLEKVYKKNLSHVFTVEMKMFYMLMGCPESFAETLATVDKDVYIYKIAK